MSKDRIMAVTQTDKILNQILDCLILIHNKIPDPDKIKQQELEKLIFNSNNIKTILSTLPTGNFDVSKNQET